MRIGLVIYGSLDTLSGGYLYDRKLVDYLRSQGDSVEIISIPWRNYPRHLLDNCSVQLWSRLLHLKVDVLLQDELNHPSLFWLNGRLKGSHIPIISIVHHLRCSELRPAWQNWLYTLPERQYLHSTDGFIFNSQSTRQTVAALGVKISSASSEAKPWVVAYPAGDRFEHAMPGSASNLGEAHITRRSQEIGPLRLVFAGSLIPRKGLHTLLEALTKLPAGLCHLDVIGGMDADPAYARQVLQQTERLRLHKSVHFHGKLDDARLGARFAQAQVMVTPSSYEGFGIVYLEGMSFGLPAVASSAGAAKEIIIPGENGFLISPGDATALAEILHNLAEDRGRLVELSIAARHRFESFPTWEESAALIRDFLLHDIVGSTQRI